MRRFRGSGRRALLVLCAVAVGVAFVLPAGFASAADNLIPTKISLLKWGGNPRVGKLYKIVSKPVVLFALPAVGTGPEINGGDLTVQVGAGQVTCNLNNTSLWKGLGNPAGSKGYKYVNSAAPTGDLCKIVIVKEKVIKVLAKGVGTVALPGDTGTNPDVTMVLTVGLDRYCAEATAPHFKEKAETLIKMKDQPAPGACAGPPTTTTTIITTTTTAPPTTTTTSSGCDCSPFSQIAFETGIPTGAEGGKLRNFRCSNNTSAACADDSDCDVGPCYIVPPFCQDLLTSCTQDSDCQGTCAEVIAGNLPLSLEKGGLYTGGGLNSVPLPFPVPDKGVNIHNVSGSSTLTLTETTPAEVGARQCTQGRTCDNNPSQHCVLDADCGAGNCQDNCLFGPPLPIPNSGTPATSVCTVNVVDIDSQGTVACDGGDTDVTTPLRSVIYLNGDLFKLSTPPDVPGVQPCPLCDTLCVGGSKADFPCDNDGDCPGGSCGLTTECLGGPSDGLPCTPATSDSPTLGDIENAYPTSHDCPSDPLASITDNIGGLPILFGLTSGTQQIDAEDRLQGKRTFCGFCRDVTGAGSLAFEGDTAGGLPAAIPPANGNAVACTSDADCLDGDEYESCVQRNPGAFSEAASTRITLTGDPGSACLDDGLPLAQSLVSIFCIPPTFDSTVDAAGDLPGPGSALMVGEAQLLP